MTEHAFKNTISTKMNVENIVRTVQIQKLC